MTKIKVGDTIVLKKGPEYKGDHSRHQLPLKVDSIYACPHKASNKQEGVKSCFECPGYINKNMCFGRGNTFVVEPMRDWDD